MSLPAWLLALLRQTLATAGKFAARQLCKKLMGDETCKGQVYLIMRLVKFIKPKTFLVNLFN